MTGFSDNLKARFARDKDSMAAYWLSRQECGLSDEEKKQFDNWLAEDPANEASFFEHQVAWAAFEELDEWKPKYSNQPNPDLFARKKQHPYKVWFIYGGIAASLLIGLLTFLLLDNLPANTPDAYARSFSTTKSYQRYTLVDDSIIELNADTLITIDYSNHTRNVQLHKGEAHFSVAHDPDRPFIVTSGRTRISALGTAFSVRMDQKQIEVIVTQGKVRVEESSPVSGNLYQVREPLATELSAGQVATQVIQEDYFKPSVKNVTQTEIEDKLAWKFQILDFRSTPLYEIVKEFNRHNDKQLVIADESIRSLLFTLAMKPDNIEDFLLLLEVSEGIRSREYPDGRILLSGKL